jgi:hypothetical protein
VSVKSSGSHSVAPADVDPYFGRPETAAQLGELKAVEVSDEAGPLLRVVTGQVDSGDGQAFVGDYLADLTSRAGEASTPEAVSSTPSTVGDYPVTYFYVPAVIEGYAYSEGSTVAIAINVAGPPKVKAAKDALLAILGDL